MAAFKRDHFIFDPTLGAWRQLSPAERGARNSPKPIASGVSGNNADQAAVFEYLLQKAERQKALDAVLNGTGQMTDQDLDSLKFLK